MRSLLVAVFLLLPVTATAQFPAPGTHKGQGVQALGDGQFPLYLKVARAGDSTVIELGVEGQEQTVPIAEQGVLAKGFYVRLGDGVGGLYCPFVTIDDRWEAVCEDPFGEPQVVLKFTRPT